MDCFQGFKSNWFAILGVLGLGLKRGPWPDVTVLLAGEGASTLQRFHSRRWVEPRDIWKEMGYEDIKWNFSNPITQVFYHSWLGMNLEESFGFNRVSFESGDRSDIEICLKEKWGLSTAQWPQPEKFVEKLTTKTNRFPRLHYGNPEHHALKVVAKHTIKGKSWHYLCSESSNTPILEYSLRGWQGYLVTALLNKIYNVAIKRGRMEKGLSHW